MLTKIKNHLRIKHNALDDDIQGIIEECKADLKRVGILNISDTDNLIISCAKLFARYRFNFENEGERYRLAYESMRDALSMCGEYNLAVGETDVVQ